MHSLFLEDVEYPIFDTNLCTIIHDCIVCLYNPGTADQRKYAKWLGFGKKEYWTWMRKRLVAVYYADYGR